MTLSPLVEQVDDAQVALLQTEAYDAWAALDDARQTMYDSMDELLAAQEKDRNDGDSDAALVAANRAAIDAAIKKTQPLSKALIPLYDAADKAQQAADAAAATAKTAAAKKAGDTIAQNANKNVNLVGLDLAQVKAYCDITGDDPVDILGALSANEIVVGAPPKSSQSRAVIGASAAVIKANAVNRKSATSISQTKNLHDRIKALNGKPTPPSMKAQGKTLRQQRQALARERNAVKKELRAAIQKGPEKPAGVKPPVPPVKAPVQPPKGKFNPAMFTELPPVVKSPEGTPVNTPVVKSPPEGPPVNTPVVKPPTIPSRKWNVKPPTPVQPPKGKFNPAMFTELAPPGVKPPPTPPPVKAPVQPPKKKFDPTMFRGQDAMSTSSGYQILGESVTIGEGFDIMSLLSGFLGGGKSAAAPAATAAQTQMQQMQMQQMQQMQQEAERNRRSAAAAKTTALVIGGVAGLGVIGAVVWKIAR